MKNRVIFFSGGKSSFSVADYVKNKYPEDNILLYFTDTLWEDEDLYRFIHEASNKLKLPLLIHSRGITPPQLMVMQKFMANSRVGTCSKELKMKVAADYFKKGIVPEIEIWHNKHFLKSEYFTEDPTLYFGISFEEMHREIPIRENWKPFDVAMPLIDNAIDNDEVLAKWNIRQPKLYLQNFSHNNCGGRCIKGGQRHFLNLLLKNEDRYMALMEQEIIISEYIRYSRQCKGKDYLFDEVWKFVTTGEKSAKLQHIIDTFKYTKNWNFGDRTSPYTFMKKMGLEELEKRPAQCDMFDYGGCGCFVEYGAMAV
ncbi:MULTISPECIES: phosphoadenosine phosphosulfate reductase family protein [Bacillota]|uniref:phosphoadenosine phosphosulfate reductase domain-containing protein n=1 Tax=Bacillota TaxID=1239 RepID=UPI0039EF9E39